MRTFGAVGAVLLTCHPGISLAQIDPDWSRREMERMQAQQERWDAQVARQRDEMERMQAQQERQDAQVARQRAEQERGGTRQSGANPTTARAKSMSEENLDGLSRPITSEGLDAVFKVATHVCPLSANRRTFEDAMSLMSVDERGLLLYFCTMYSLGQSTEKPASKTTPAKQ